MATFRIVVLQGDGPGPRLVGVAIRALRAIEPSLRDIGFSIEEYPCGAGEYRRGGIAMRPRTWKSLLASNAIIAGPMGLDDVRDMAGLEIEPELDIRERLGLSRQLNESNSGVVAHAGEKHALFHIVDDPLEAVAMVLEWLGDPETMGGAKRVRETVDRVKPESAEAVIRELSG